MTLQLKQHWEDTAKRVLGPETFGCLMPVRVFVSVCAPENPPVYWAKAESFGIDVDLATSMTIGAFLTTFFSLNLS